MDEAPRTSKARACTECKKLKVKCERKPGDHNCVRCRRHSYKCTSNSHLERLLEDDLEWKRIATAKTSQLQAAVSDLLRQNNLQVLSNYASSPAAASPNFEPKISLGSRSEAVVATMSMTRENSQDPEAEPELVSAPMRSLFEVTKLRNLRSNLPNQPPLVNGAEDDVISRGLLPIEEAENLFAFFNQRMNNFLWGGIALVHDNLESARRSSSLLSTAILAVAALHIPDRNDIFDICYSAFGTVLSSSIYNRYHSLDEIRGMAIGAFWLSDLSWMLSGHAVRVATEMGLHLSLRKMLRGKADQFESAQLWYLLYVCDHHFSIAYNRPPVVHGSEGIADYERFLQHPSAGPGDVRLVAQVVLFVNLTNVYHHFGSYTEQPLEESDFRILRNFNIELDTWRMKWEPKSVDSPYVGTYPSKGVVLHYYFAKFHLNSLALRAIKSDANLSIDRREAANTAISSAMATLNMVLYEPDISAALVGVPLFTHTMVAFSAVFLLKVAWKWTSAFLNIDQRQVLGLVQHVIDTISSVRTSDKHLTYHIANGLSKMLAKFRSRDSGTPLHFIPNINNRMEITENQNLGQEQVTNFFENVGLDLPETWDEFPTSLDLFPITFPAVQNR